MDLRYDTTCPINLSRFSAFNEHTDASIDAYVYLKEIVPYPMLKRYAFGETINANVCDQSASLACENPDNHPDIRPSGIYCYTSKAFKYYTYLISSWSANFQFSLDISFINENGTTNTLNALCSSASYQCVRTDENSSTFPWINGVFQIIESSLDQLGSISDISQTLVIADGTPLLLTTDKSVIENWFFIDSNSPEVDGTRSSTSDLWFLKNCLVPSGSSLGLSSDSSNELPSNEDEENKAMDPFPESSRYSWATIFGSDPSALSLKPGPLDQPDVFLLNVEMNLPTSPAGLLNVFDLNVRIPFQNDSSIEW